MRRLDELGFEQLLRQQAQIRACGTLALGDVAFLDPYGLLGLLCLGRVFRRDGLRIALVPPRDDEVKRYLERMDSLSVLRESFQVADAMLAFPGERYRRSRESRVLLEVTPIRHSRDVHGLVHALITRTGTILRAHLHYDDLAVDRFAVALAEICQNIPDHSGDLGLVAIQRYHYGSQGMNRVCIAAMDCGVGIRASLEGRYGRQAAPWDDAAAIALALEPNTSRFNDPGRGNGLTQVCSLAMSWGGRMSIRSGRGKVVLKAGHPPRTLRGLPFFPGTQVSLELPQRGLSRNGSGRAADP